MRFNIRDLLWLMTVLSLLFALFIRNRERKLSDEYGDFLVFQQQKIWITEMNRLEAENAALKSRKDK